MLSFSNNFGVFLLRRSVAVYGTHLKLSCIGRPRMKAFLLLAMKIHQDLEQVHTTTKVSIVSAPPTSVLELKIHLG